MFLLPPLHLEGTECPLPLSQACAITWCPLYDVNSWAEPVWKKQVSTGAPGERGLGGGLCPGASPLLGPLLLTLVAEGP